MVLIRIKEKKNLYVYMYTYRESFTRGLRIPFHDFMGLLSLECIAKNVIKKNDEIVYEILSDKEISWPLICFKVDKNGKVFYRFVKLRDFDEDGNLRVDDFKEAYEVYLLEVKEVKEIYVPILEELKNYKEKMDFEWIIESRCLEDHVRSHLSNPIGFLFESIFLSRSSILASRLEEIKKRLYELWIIKLICEALEIKKFKGHIFNGKPYWMVKERSEKSLCIGESKYGDITIWFEFQPGMWAALPERFRGFITLTPDIVVVKGYYEETKKFIEEDYNTLRKPIDLLIECKEKMYTLGTTFQVSMYKSLFQPLNTIVCSPYTFKENEKERMKKEGIKVFENLNPNNKEATNNFCSFISEIFK